MTRSRREREARRRPAFNRRKFIGLVGAAAASGLAAPALSQSSARIVIVGGGAGGASLARNLAAAAPELSVTLINASSSYTTPSFSNLYLAGFRSLNSLTHRYARLREMYGVNTVFDRALAIDASARRVMFAGGEAVEYDRLALSPGVSFVSGAIEGFDAVGARQMPHAYGGGFQAYLLKQRLVSVRPGGVFAIAAPSGPYRCPSAPYERASMAANYFMRENPRAKILIFDAKDRFDKQEAFTHLWSEFYGDMIEWTPGSLSGGGVRRIEPDNGVIEIGSGERLQVDAANVIPPQQAAGLLFGAGLADDDGWVSVDAASMRVKRDPNIFVLGDAARAGEMSKSAAAAQSQAEICAIAILAELQGAVAPPPTFDEAIWSFVGSHDALVASAKFAIQEGRIRAISRTQSAPDNSEQQRLDNALAANAWYVSATSRMFA